MATWESKQLADSGTLKDLAAQGENAITAISTFMTIASEAASIAKQVLSTVANPAASAAAALADSIIASLNNYKESGYYALIVNPMDEKYGSKKVTSKGFEMRRDNTGAVLFPVTTVTGGLDDNRGRRNSPNDTYRQSLNVSDLGNYMDSQGRSYGTDGFIPPAPELTFPLKLVEGGYNPTNWTGTMGDIVSIPTFDAVVCRNIMAEAFDDKGDIPKFIVQEGAKNKTTFEDGSKTPFTADGIAISSADWSAASKGAKVKFDLYESGNTALSRTDRTKITTQISSGRPNYQGNTELSGQTINGLVFIVAAQDPSDFLNSLFAIAALLPGLPDLSDLVEKFKAIFEPENVEVTIAVDTKYGQFKEGDILRGEASDAIGEVVEIKSTVNSVIEFYVDDITYDEDGEPNGTQLILSDGNADGRWKDTILTYKPLGDILSMTSKLTPGEPVYEQRTTTHTNSDGTTVILYFDKGAEYKNVSKRNMGTKTTPLTDAETNVSPNNLPKYGRVIGLDALTPESKDPDFFSIQTQDMIPGWSEFFDGMIQLANGIKGIAVDTSVFIQGLIDTIDDLLDRFTKLAAALTQLIELLTTGLPNAGIWYLGMTTSNGNEGFKTGILNSDGAPDASYKFSAGIVLVGDPVVKQLTGRDPLEVLFGDIMGVDFQSV